jgi:hypothetical protein
MPITIPIGSYLNKKDIRNNTERISILEYRVMELEKHVIKLIHWVKYLESKNQGTK